MKDEPPTIVQPQSSTAQEPEVGKEWDGTKLVVAFVVFVVVVAVAMITVRVGVGS